MWEYEYAAATTATPERLYALWTDVAGWPGWNSDVLHAELSGAFVTGSRIRMTTSDATLDLRLADVRPDERFTDEVDLDGLLIRTTHHLQPLADGQTRVTYRLQITGPNAGEIGPELGPAITHDFPDTVTALIRRAER